MKKYFLILIFPFIIFGQGITAKHKAVVARMNMAAGGSPCSNTGDVYTQSFEGTGYAANGDWGNETETASNGGVDEDYTTVVHCGSQSVQCASNSAFGRGYISVLPNSSSTIFYFRFYMYVETDGWSDGGSNPSLFILQNSSSRGARVVMGKSSGQKWIRFEYYNGTSFSYDTGQTSYNISTGVWYRVEGYFNASGTGEGWEFRVDGSTIDSGTDNTLGGFDSSTNMIYGCDPSGSDTGVTLFDGVEVSTGGWIGE